MESVVVIIPAFNAEETLPELLHRLKPFVEPGDVIVVDDGSSDGTPNIVRQAGNRLLQHGANRGKGAALRTGFEEFCSRDGRDCLITMDADLQHLPEELPRFLERRRKGRANIVVGERLRVGTAMPVHRILSNMITSGLVSARTGQVIRDSQSGYRLVGREVLDAISIESDGYEAETEFLIKAALKGFVLESVPITTVYGNERSYMTHWNTTKRFLQILLKDY